MGLRARALLIGLGAVAIAACGLAAAPGDHAGEPRATVEGGGGGQDATTPDGSAPPIDAAGGIARFVLLSGERDPSGPADNPPTTNDVWTAFVDGDGAVVGYRVEVSAIVRGTMDFGAVLGDQWVVGGYGYGVGGSSNHAVQFVGWQPGVKGDWVLGAFSPPSRSDHTRTMFGANIVMVGGYRSVTDDGGTTTTYVKDVFAAPIDVPQRTVGTFTAQASSLNRGRSRAGVYVHANKFLYVVGGKVSSSTLIGGVEVAPVDPMAGTVGAFTDQPGLAAPPAAPDYKLFEPSLISANGWLYVAGGRLNTSNSPSDIVIAAKINEADGSLGDWKVVTKLPAPLRDFGFATYQNRLYVFGGVGATQRTDEVLSATIGADGELGAWEAARNAKLPGSRADIRVATY